MKRRAAVINLDLLFIVILTAAFAAMLVGSGELRPAAAEMPRIVSLAGLGLVAVLAFQKIRVAMGADDQASRILDIGYEHDEVDASPRDIWLRTGHFFALLAGMIGTVWLLGFHVGLPLFVLGYLIVAARTRFWPALICAVFLELAITGVYGALAGVSWPESPLETLLDVRMQELFEFYRY
jgi:hypothetical protein